MNTNVLLAGITTLNGMSKLTMLSLREVSKTMPTSRRSSNGSLWEKGTFGFCVKRVTN